MTQQPTTKHQKGFFKNDRKLVCSMLVLYGLCILGSITATLWGLNRRQLTLSANATSTAYAVATERAKVTATVRAHATEQAQYELVDPFDWNKYSWRAGYEYSKYWNGMTRVKDGVYSWYVDKPKDTFISWADFSREERVQDFDVYVDTRVTEGGFGDVCSGLLFRISPDGWDAGGYYFALCNNGVVKISYHTEKDGWDRIATLPYPKLSSHWNRLEINARGSHFTFLVNNEQVYEMDDTRQSVGGLALVIELNEKNPAEILFDNFGFQSR